MLYLISKGLSCGSICRKVINATITVIIIFVYHDQLVIGMVHSRQTLISPIWTSIEAIQLQSTCISIFYHATFMLWQRLILWHYLDAQRCDYFVTRFDIILYASVAFCLYFNMSKKHYLKTHTGWMFHRFLSLKC